MGERYNVLKEQYKLLGKLQGQHREFLTHPTKAYFA